MRSRRDRRPPSRPARQPLLESLESRLLLSTATSTALVTSNPTLTAYVVSSDNGPLTGSVTFRDGSTTLGTAALQFVLAGRVDVFAATFSAALVAGSHTLSATYSGDSTHASSQSAKTVTIPPYALLAFGATPGEHGVITVYDVHTGLSRSFTPFPGFNGAVNVAVGIHDGLPIVVATPGIGGGAFIKVLNPLTGTQVVPMISAFSNTSTGGLTIATGDLNDDGNSDIIVGQETGGSIIKEFNGADNANFAVLATFNAFVTGYKGGIRVAAGDLNADGDADVAAVTASGAALCTVFSGDTQTSLFTKNFGPGYTGGGYVAIGDFFGAGHAALALSYANHALPVVQLYRITSTTPAFTFLAYPATFTNSGGVYVAAVDLNGDGTADYVTTLASSNRLRFINGATGAPFTALNSTFANFNFGQGFANIDGFNEIVA